MKLAEKQPIALQRPATQNYPNRHTRNWSPPTNFLPCGDDRHRSTARSLHRPLTAPSIAARGASHVHAVLHAANIVQRIESRWQLLSLAGSWSRTTFAVVRCSVQDKRASRTLRLSCSKGLAHRPSPSAIPSRVLRSSGSVTLARGGDHTFKRH